MVGKWGIKKNSLLSKMDYASRAQAKANAALFTSYDKKKYSGGGGVKDMG